MGFFSKKSKADEAAKSFEVTLGDGSTQTVVQVVDCIGDNCPRPQLMTKKAIRQIDVGQVVEVHVDNPSSMEALPPMCNGLGATHLDTVKTERFWKVYIRKD